MTDIYCFNEPMYLNNKKIWSTIHSTIYKATSITRKIKSINEYYKFFKQKKYNLWTECYVTPGLQPDDIIKNMIFRSIQISNHELIYLHAKSNPDNWLYDI